MLFLQPRLTEALTDCTSAWASPVPGSGVTVEFDFHDKLSPREATARILNTINTLKVDWLQKEGSRWRLDLDALKRRYPDHDKYEDWFTGKVVVELEIEHALQDPPPVRRPPDEIFINERPFKRYVTECRLLVNLEIALEQIPNKIFLSHKSADKEQVRRFRDALRSVGFEVWLDEDAMTAGANLERELLKGFKDSCAAVFFCTPNYVDENFLAIEVEYALAEKRARQDKFAIIALVFKDAEGKEGQVPQLLQRFVFKPAPHELSAFVEIVRALPITPPTR